MDRELYHACMNMCTGLFHFFCKKEEINIRMKYYPHDEDEMKRIMEYEKKRLKSNFTRLKEVVDKISGDMDG